MRHFRSIHKASVSPDLSTTYGNPETRTFAKDPDSQGRSRRAEIAPALVRPRPKPMCAL